MKKIFALLTFATMVLSFEATKDVFAEDAKPNATPAPSQNARVLQPGYIDYETYTGLLDDMINGKHTVPKSSNGISFGKTDVFVEFRYHYAINGGAERFSRNSSGFRTYITFNTTVNDKWRIISMLEMQNDLINYRNLFKPLQRLYALGRLGTHTISGGSFGYLMAEGNVYDSGFTGIRSTFGSPVKYTLSYGETNDTEKTAVFTARYDKYDYNLEAGVYRYKFKDDHYKNTLFTFAGNYNFENFSMGGMFLNSNQKDEVGNKRGYVFSLRHGELKTWRKGTYGVYLKYYDQPRGTYIAHGMNGRGNSMHGFKGYGVGINYTLAPNILLNVERYDLEDKVTGEKGTTWWNSLTFFY